MKKNQIEDCDKYGNIFYGILWLKSKSLILIIKFNVITRFPTEINPTKLPENTCLYNKIIFNRNSL